MRRLPRRSGAGEAVTRYYIIKWTEREGGWVWRDCLDTLDEGFGSVARDRALANCARLNRKYPERRYKVFTATVEWKPVRNRRKR